jgi:pantetheine-phosphate adenylyltransferase
LETVADFDYEYRMSTTNQIVLPGLETVFLMAEPEYGYISSTLVRQIASCNGDIARFVPELVLDALKEGK